MCHLVFPVLLEASGEKEWSTAVKFHGCQMSQDGWGSTWLAWLVEHAALDLRIVKSKPHVGCRGYLKIKVSETKSHKEQ